MKKLLLIHPAIAPYLVDQFNHLSELFDLEVIFIFDNVWNHKFDQSKLMAQLKFKYSYLLKGPHYKGRVFRFGILRKIRKSDPDIIIGYEYSFITQYLILLKRLGLIKQKLGSTIDDSIDICHHIQSKIRFFARKNSVHQLDYLVVFTTEVSKYYQDTFKLNENQIIVSPILQEPERLRSNGEELERIAKQYSQKYQLKGKKVLLFVGRFIPEKALPKFIKTINNFLQEQQKVVLILVGDGEDRQILETLVREKRLEKTVLLPGRYEGQELYPWYLCASGFVLPSTYEPYGAVVNEALIFGLKTFCSRYAGASSLIDTEKGMLFDPLKEKETVEKLKYFLDSIVIIEEIDMNDKPSLMSNHQESFIKEWSKLNNE